MVANVRLPIHPFTLRDLLTLLASQVGQEQGDRGALGNLPSASKGPSCGAQVSGWKCRARQRHRSASPFARLCLFITVNGRGTGESIELDNKLDLIGHR